MTNKELNTTEIKAICLQIADYYKDLMRKADYDPNGELMNFTWTTEYDGHLFNVYFNLPDYWYYAENGRRPGKFPPPDAIMKWILFKRLFTRTSGRFTSTKQLCYLISRKIALKGTQGKHLLLQTIDDTYDTIVDLLVNAITNELEKEIEKELE